MRRPLTRRQFITSSALLGGGLVLSFAIPRIPSLQESSPPKSFPFHAFLQISEQDSIHIRLTKVEMGQGISTTLAMLIAEELDCEWTRIQVEHSPAGELYADPIWGQSTGGSTSTSSEFDRYRQVGATARLMLMEAAARRLGRQANECRTENGVVIIGERRFRYGQLAAEASQLPIPTVKLLEPKRWKYIGTSQKSLQNPDQVSGKAIYGIDISFPGLLTALVAHAPVFGARVRTFDATQAMAIAGVRRVVQIPSGIAVIAAHYWAAKLGRDALKIEWDLGAYELLDTTRQVEEYRQVANSKGLISQQKGEIAPRPTKEVHTLKTEHILPYLAHAPMEPLNCTVKMEADSCQIWAGTQNPLLYQSIVADLLGFASQQVMIHTPLLGGSFGRKASFDADWVVEAVHIAKASGEAIKLVWSREDDIRGGYYRPLYLHRALIHIGSDGFPTSWHHHIVGQSLFTNTPLEKLIVDKGIDYSSVGGVHGSPYLQRVDQHCVELHTTSLAVPVLPWRSVGHSHTAFVMETLIDELATLASKDPVDYRRVLLKDHPRYLSVLNLAADKAGWGKTLPPGRFQGIALHAAMGSYVCQVVELSLENRKLQIHKVVCGIDCGLAVNPDGVRAQMEGGIVFGLTAALYGEISLEKGRVKQSNFHDYRLLRIKEMPSIQVYILESKESMGGAGEPGVPPIAPALANALFSATGKRFRSLPLPSEF